MKFIKIKKNWGILLQRWCIQGIRFMKFRKIIFPLKFYLKTISKKLISSILSSFGALWLITEIGIFFFGETSPIIIGIKEYWVIFLFIGFFIAIILTKPKFTIGGKLNNRDISIEVTIGDLFRVCP
jgi:hypothetical protein